MALPAGGLSSTPVASTLVTPDDRARNQYTQDWERGGVGLNDPSQGLNVRDWRVHTDGATIWVTPDPEGAPTTAVLTGSDITEVALAFDQNMQATVAFVEGGAQKLWWYDTVLGAMTVSTFAGCRSGMLSMDDKRAGADAYNDIIFAYIRDGQARYRQQRDRYNVEYTLGPVPGPSSRILQLGMGVNNRLQFKVSSPPAAVHTDLLTDTLFVVSADDVLPVATGDAQTANWRSKTFVFDEQPSFGWARVEGDYPVVVKLYGDGVLFFTSPPITSQKPFRVPARRFREWVVELEGAAKVVAFAMAQDIGELL